MWTMSLVSQLTALQYRAETQMKTHGFVFSLCFYHATFCQYLKLKPGKELHIFNLLEPPYLKFLRTTDNSGTFTFMVFQHFGN